MVLPVTSLYSLPIGYPEDFNGCSTEIDKEKRSICCDSVAEDCDEQCGEIYDPKKSPGGWIVCGWECSDANRSCKDGSTVEGRIDWPDRPGLRIPGVHTDGYRIVADEGIELGISTRSVVIEVRSEDRSRVRSACAALVTSCSCPQKSLGYGTVGKECRPVAKAGVAECQICSTGKDSQACEQCDDCVPVVLSVRAYAAESR